MIPSTDHLSVLYARSSLAARLVSIYSEQLSRSRKKCAAPKDPFREQVELAFEMFQVVVREQVESDEILLEMVDEECQRAEGARLKQLVRICEMANIEYRDVIAIVLERMR